MQDIPIRLGSAIIIMGFIWVMVMWVSCIKRSIAFDKERYRGRNVIERCIGRLKQWRRVATRYEKLAANYLAVILVAASMHFVNLLLL